MQMAGGNAELQEPFSDVLIAVALLRVLLTAEEHDPAFRSFRFFFCQEIYCFLGHWSAPSAQGLPRPDISVFVPVLEVREVELRIAKALRMGNGANVHQEVNLMGV